MTSRDVALLETLWSALDFGARGPACPSVELSGAPGLPSVVRRRLLRHGHDRCGNRRRRGRACRPLGEPLRSVHVDRGHASVAFRCERFVSAQGWTLPPVWDPIAGDYRARDGWIRLHTNYRNHRDAVLRVLGCAGSRDAVERAARTWSAEDLEAAVVAEGGCAARLRTAAEWAAHPQGVAVSREPLFALTTRSARSPFPGPASVARPSPASGSSTSRG